MITVGEVEAEVIRVFSDPKRLATSDRIDRAAKDRAVDGVLAAVPATFDRNDRAELDASMPLGYVVEHCLDRRVSVARSRLALKHLRRGELVYLVLRFSDFAPWWRASWHVYRAAGNTMRHSAHELSDLAFLADHRAIAEVAGRVARAAADHGWMALPADVETRHVRPPGWTHDVPLVDLVFWGG
jgi:hypothetical protein